MYRIKQLSQLTDFSPEAIRYYERIGVLEAPDRSSNGYRIYTNSDVEHLRFIRRARQLDFTLENITEILALRDRGQPPCPYVQQLLKRKIAEVQDRIRDLEQLRDELMELDQIGHHISLNEDAVCICQILETKRSQQLPAKAGSLSLTQRPKPLSRRAGVRRHPDGQC